MSETLVAYGGAIKALAGGKLGGYLAVYGDARQPDLEGEFFTPATDFGFEGEHRVGVYYLHGLDPTLGKRRIGQARLRRDPVGVWIEAQLDLRDAYERAVYGLAQRGALGWSSGAAAARVERAPTARPQSITRWPIIEASLTPAPAEPRAQVVPIKSLKRVEEIRMSDELHLESAVSAEPAAQPESVNSRLDALTDQIGRVLRLMEDSPAVRRAGYYTVDGGAADPAIKSFGDWLLAVMRGDELRLRTVYRSSKTLSGDVGSAGGYSVPMEYGAQLLQVAASSSPVLSRVRRIPVSAPVGEYPALDQYLAPTAGSGDTALAGGVKPKKRGEGAAYSETEPEFEMIRYRVNDAASGMIKVTKELRADSPAGIEAFLRNVIGVAVANKVEYAILRGNGVGEPLGILNAPARINVDPDTDNKFAYADAVEMVGRFKAVAGAPVWIYHPGMINDIAVFQVASGGATFVSNLSAGPAMNLLGYPLITSEHLPAPDASGCVVLADLGAYVLFERGGLYIEFSEHAAFTEGKDIWRFGMRCDGQPWMKSSITLADPSGTYTVSPFVAFND